MLCDGIHSLYQGHLYFRNITLFHGMPVDVILLIFVRKFRDSLPLLSRNPEILNAINP